MKLLFVLLVVGLMTVGLVYTLDWGENNNTKEDFNLGNEFNKMRLGNIGKSEQPKNNSSMETPTMIIDANKQYVVKLKTSAGEIDIELNAKQTPITANNFIYLVSKNFYDNTIFHRVLKGFMIQGGDPKGDGTGGPGYRFEDEEFDGEYTRGTIAMANAGPDTNGSQFFIMHKDNDLPKNYVIFGKVIAGMEVVDQIAQAPVEDNGSGEKSRPIDPVKIESTEVIEK